MHLGGSEQDRCAIVQYDFEFRGKKFDATTTQAGCVQPALFFDTPHDGLHASNEFLVIVGFANVIIRTDVKSLQFRFDAVLGGHEDEGGLISLSAQRFGKFKTVDIGHHDIEDKQVRFALLDHLHGATRVVSSFDFIALLAKYELNERVCETVIIYDKNIHVFSPSSVLRLE